MSGVEPRPLGWAGFHLSLTQFVGHLSCALLVGSFPVMAPSQDLIHAVGDDVGDADGVPRVRAVRARYLAAVPPPRTETWQLIRRPAIHIGAATSGPGRH